MIKLDYNSAVKKCRDIHGDKYSYENLVYSGYSNAIEIICPIHGSFTIAFSNHIKGYGCRKCLTRGDSHDEIVEKIHKNFPNLLILSNAKNHCSKVIVEDELGIKYNIEISSLIRGYVPSIETAIDKNKAFEIKSRLIHGDLYDYSKVKYINATSNVIITCPIHGDFETKPTIHMRGSICMKCFRDKITILKSLSDNGWTCTKWISSAEKSNHFDSYKLYVLLCSGIDETFIKIGRTFNKINKRYGAKSSLPYEYEILHQISGEPRYIYDLETSLKSKFKKYKYKPKLWFGGSFECFDSSIIDKIKFELK